MPLLRRYKIPDIRVKNLKSFFLNPKSVHKRTYIALGLLLLILPIALVALLRPSPSAAWFDEAWGFRRKVPVSNSTGSTQEDFQIKITLDTTSLVDDGKIQSDCADIRVTSNSGELLPYWVEPDSCDTTETTVWTKISSLATGSSTLYLYYGNPSAISAAANTSDIFIREMESAVAAWPLDDEDTTQSYARVFNTGKDEGRNIVINGGFDSDTSWTKNTGWTIANGVAHSDGSGATSTILQSSPIVAGKAYEVTYTISNYISGTVRVQVGSSGHGTNRSANGTYTEKILASGNTEIRFNNNTSFVGDIDNVSVKQVNIPSSSSTVTNLLTDGDMEAVDTSAWTAGGSATLSKQTTNPHNGRQVLRIARSNVNNPFALQPGILTTGKTYRVYGYARSDGSAIPRIARGSAAPMWDGNTSTSWQSFDFVFVAAGANDMLLTATTSTGNQYVEFDDVVVTEDTGIRSGELLQDGDMEASGTGVWNASNLTISKQTGSPHGGSQVLRASYDGLHASGAINQHAAHIVVGKTYRLTGYGRSDGSSTFRIRNGASTDLFLSTTSTSWQYFDVIWIASSNYINISGFVAGTGNYVEFDDLSLTEVSPLVGKFSSTASQKPTLGTDSSGHLSKAYSFDGTDDNVNIFSSDLNSTFNPDEGTLVAWAKVSDAGVWSDGTTRYLLQFGPSTSNKIIIYKQSGSNALTASYLAGGTSTGVTKNNFNPTEFFSIIITWDKSVDEVKVYINGVQEGGTLTSLGTWNQNLHSSYTIIGAANSNGHNSWSGLINDVRLYDRALTAEEIAAGYNEDYDLQHYYSNYYPGYELIRKYDADVTIGALGDEEKGTGPVAHWSFDDVYDQTVQDNTANNNDGTLGATSSSEASDPSIQTEDMCVNGKCLYFDGTDDYANVTDTDNLNFGDGEDITVSAWYRNTGSSTTTNTIVAKKAGERGSADAGYGLYVTPSNGRAYFQVSDGTDNFYVRTPDDTLQRNQWYHLVGVIDRDSHDNSIIYVNGVNKTAGTGGTLGNINDMSNTEPLRIGANSAATPDEKFKGFIDDVKIYNYARSEDQILQDYNKGAAVLAGVPNQKFLSDGLVGYWKMDESGWDGTSGEVVDASGNGNHGTAAGGATTGAGKYGNGGSFDGVDDATNILSASEIPTGSDPRTISMWIKINQSTTKVFLSYGNRSVNRLFGIGTQSGKLGVHYYGNNISNDFPNSTLNIGQWQFLTLTYDGTDIVSYINGVKKDTKTVSLNTGSTSNLVLGSDTSGSFSYPYLDGSIDETRIYNRALSPSEVQALYKWAPGPEAHWKFEEASWNGTANEVKDSSGNGNHGRSVCYGVGCVKPTGGAQGKFGKAADFSSPVINGYVETPDVIGGQRAYTISLWANKNDLSSGGNEQGLFSAYVAQYFRTTSNGTIVFGLQSSDSVFDIWVPGANCNMLLGWHYYTVTVESNGVLTCYRDGVKASSSNYEGAVWEYQDNASSGYSRIGHYGNSFLGKIDDVKVYNYARTQEQILQDMNGGQTSPPSSTGQTLPDPVAHWKFDEGSGQIAYDSSGNMDPIATILTEEDFETTDGWTTNNASVSLQNSNPISGNQVLRVTSTADGNSYVVKHYLTTGKQYKITGYARGDGTNEPHVWTHGDQQWIGTTSTSWQKFEVISSATNTAVQFKSFSTSGGYTEFDDVKIVEIQKQEHGTLGTSFGTNTSDPSWETNCKNGGCLSFDGGDYVNIATGGILGTSSNMTISSWIKSADSLAAIYGEFTADGSQTRNYLHLSSGYLRFDQYNPSGGEITSTQQVHDSSWHHVLYTQNGTARSLYIDGKLAISDNNAETYSGTAPTVTRIGYRGSGSATQGFTGLIDDVKIYNVALTAEQVRMDYNGGAAINFSGTADEAEDIIDGAGDPPVAHWTFDEKEGFTANDKSGNGNTGTISGATWTKAAECKVGTCLSFDGVDDYVTITDSPSLDAENMTVSFWMNTTQTGGNSSAWYSNTTVMERDQNGTSNAGWAIQMKNDKIQVVARDDDLISSTAINNGSWNYVTFVKTTTNKYIYINGKLDTSEADTGIISNDENIYIAQENGSDSAGQIYDGLIDDVKIYNYARTPAQIAYDYSRGAPIAHWKFDECQGTTINNSQSSNSNLNGTINIGPAGSQTEVGTCADGSATAWGNGASGKWSASLNFDGTDDYVSVPYNSAIDFTNEIFSFSGWVKRASASTAYLLAKSSQTTGYGLYINSTGDVRLVGSGMLTVATPTGKITLNNWHHIVAVSDGTNAHIYVDGILQASSTTRAITSTSGDIQIGKSESNSYYFTGQIDDVQIFNYALSADQVKKLYNGSSAVYFGD